jgi:hypothetical protein
MSQGRLRVFHRRIKGSLDQEDLRVRHATSPKISIGAAVLVHKRNAVPGVAIEVSDHLTLSTSRFSGRYGRRMADDSNFNVEFPAARTIPVFPIVKEAPQLFGLNERYRR